MTVREVWQVKKKKKKEYKPEICEGWVNHDDIYFISWSYLFFHPISEILWVYDHWLGAGCSFPVYCQWQEETMTQQEEKVCP